MHVVFTQCAGREVHKKRVRACRITPDPAGQQAKGVVAVRAFGTQLVDLLALSDRLAAAGSTPVAMESTGEYWTSGLHLLEGTVQVFLVNARHVKRVPGRKRDQAAARWLAQLKRDGVRRASFMPPAGPRDLRDVPRDRSQLVQERSREVNRGQGALERAHITLASVATAMMGVAGRPILAALVEGGADPGTEESAGKQRSGRTQHGTQPLRTVLPPLAHAAAQTKGTYLSARDHCLVARRGRTRAIVAVAHAMVVSAFYMFELGA